MSQKLYGINEAAQYLNLSTSAVKYHVHKAKNLKPSKVGHSFIFTQDELDHFQATRRPQGRPKKTTE